MIVDVKNKHLLIFALTVLLVWGIGTFAWIYFYPNLVYNSWEGGIVKQGFNGTPIPVNTLYTPSALASPSTASSSVAAGANHDTLYTVGVLNLSNGPEILHVPPISGRYYSIEFVDSRGDDFAVVGSHTTGTHAGNYLISGPGWSGQMPENVTQIAAPDDKVLLIGRVLVKNDTDVSTVYDLSKQIDLTPLK